MPTRRVRVLALPVALLATMSLLAACGGSSGQTAATAAPAAATDSSPATQALGSAAPSTAAPTTRARPKPTTPPTTPASTVPRTTVPEGCPSVGEIANIIGLPNVTIGITLLVRGKGGTCNYTWPDKNGKPNGYDHIGVVAKVGGTVADVGIGNSGCPRLTDLPEACGGFVGSSPDLEQANFDELVDGHLVLVRFTAAIDYHFGAKLFDFAKQVAALVLPRF